MQTSIFRSRWPSQNPSNPAPTIEFGISGRAQLQMAVRPVKVESRPKVCTRPVPVLRNIAQTITIVAPPTITWITTGFLAGLTRVVTTITPADSIQQASAVAELDIWISHAAIVARVPYPNNSRVRSLPRRLRQVSSTFHVSASPNIKQIIPKAFLSVVTPVHAIWPPREYVRPYSGKYRMKRTEIGINTTPTRAKKRLIAASHWGSVNTIRTITMSPKDLTHRFPDTSG